MHHLDLGRDPTTGSPTPESLRVARATVEALAGSAPPAVWSVVSGHPVFVFHDGTGEVRITTGPGDFLYVPPFVPHREENPDPHEPAVMVIARSSQEPIMVKLPELYLVNGGASRR